MNLLELIKNGQQTGGLLDVSVANLESWLQGNFLPDWALQSLTELIEKKTWGELNERFHKTLSFGTGGIRGRTIGNVITQAEKGSVNSDLSYDHPCVGTSCLNDINIIQSTIGLYRYCYNHIQEQEYIPHRPRLLIAYDVRFFSKHFCELIASTWIQLGGDAYIFDGPRSTPHLSFFARNLKSVGIMVTASHNPYYYNGIKVYFEDGAQITGSNARKVVNAINGVDVSETKDYFSKDLSNVILLPPIVDESYVETIKEEVTLDEELIRTYKPRSVFTSLHGTGSTIIPQLIEQLQLDCHIVESQAEMDPRFPTVSSPNPERPEAFAVGIAEAKELDAEFVIAVDPDADRIGISVRNEKKEFVHLTGNQVFAMLTEYRIEAMKRLKWLKKKNLLNSNAAIIKTFVTTPLVDAIAKANGLKVINTLTGFKWIGEKLLEYELVLKERLRKTQGVVIDFDKTTPKKRKDLLERHSTFFVLGGEESYGYLATETVRDKDANAAFLLICELAAHLHREGTNFLDYLNTIYIKYGYYYEDMLEIYLDSPSGEKKIKKILENYRNHPPKKMNGKKVLMVTDFLKDEIFDADGKRIPPEDFLVIKLINGYSVAMRASGTEPKIKFYLFAHEPVDNPDSLQKVKASAKKQIDEIKASIQEDVKDFAS